MGKQYPQVEVMIGGESTITREMTAAEMEMWDFCEGEQWTPEQIADMAANPAKGTLGVVRGVSLYKTNRIGGS